jgi:hypothetical protein
LVAIAFRHAEVGIHAGQQIDHMLFAESDLGGQFDRDAGAGVGGQLGGPQHVQLFPAVGGGSRLVDGVHFALVVLQRPPGAAGGVLQGAGHIVAELLACGHVSIVLLFLGA